MPHWGTGRKYGNKIVYLDGYRFDSQREARRYGDLCLMQKSGVIAELCAEKSQLRYTCIVNGVTVCRYTADFRYRDVATGKIVVEDAKSPATRKIRDWSIRKHLMLACHGIVIQEV
jgi:hypothetical protein